MTFEEWFENKTGLKPEEFDMHPAHSLVREAWEESDRYAYCRARQDEEDIDNGRWK